MQLKKNFKIVELFFTIQKKIKIYDQIIKILAQLWQVVNSYMGSSTETVAFQVYEILKINHEFLQFFCLGSKI